MTFYFTGNNLDLTGTSLAMNYSYKPLVAHIYSNSHLINHINNVIQVYK